MNYCIKTYTALPCETSEFKINGKEANKNDFGKTDSMGDGNYGCLYNKFIPFRHAPDGVLQKYNITLDEFLTIGDELEEKLYITGCSWCS